MDRIIGIDLGTSNSCVCVVEHGKPEVIPNKGGYTTTPSIVAIAQSGKRLVGQIAKRQALTNADNTVYAAKRLIGRVWDSVQVQSAIRVNPFQIVKGPHEDARVELRGRVYSIPEISSFVLAELRMIAEERLGEPVNKAVVTVPAYFNDNQRQATKHAGHLAGLDVLRIINEPTAAALAYGFGRTLSKRIAVYDLGGGTFDVSILEIFDGVYEVVATGGDSYLGGEDFDDRIIEWLVHEFAKAHRMDLRQDRMALQRLKDAAEKAKCELSVLPEVEISLPFIITAANGEAIHLQSKLTRQILDELVEDLVEKTIRLCQETLAEAKLTTEMLDEVVLVGGQTRMPLVRHKVAGLFGREPCKGVHPDEAVAVGAALQGASLKEDVSDVLLLDVTPHSLGLMIMDGSFHPLIPKNTRVPTGEAHTFTTTRRGQTNVKIMVFQGEAPRAAQNELLGEFVLTGLRAAPAGEVEIEVNFDIDADGIVSVSARDLETGLSQKIQVTAASGLTEEEIQQMIKENQDYTLAVKSADELERAKIDQGRLIKELGGLMGVARTGMDKLQVGEDVFLKADQVLAACRKAMDRNDLSGLKACGDSLGRTLEVFKAIVKGLEKPSDTSSWGGEQSA